MSWPFASFLILALALAGGFAWYERSRPSSRAASSSSTVILPVRFRSSRIPAIALSISPC